MHKISIGFVFCFLLYSLLFTTFQKLILGAMQLERFQFLDYCWKDYDGIKSGIDFLDLSLPITQYWSIETNKI